jgi:hypothetical protein
MPSVFVLSGSAVKALERDGIEGSFGILGLSTSLVGMPNVPESEGTVRCAKFTLKLVI